MGRGRKSFLAFFGFKKTRYQGEEAAEAEKPRPRKNRPRDDEEYAESDIDRKSKEYIDRVRKELRLIYSSSGE